MHFFQSNIVAFTMRVLAMYLRKIGRCTTSNAGETAASEGPWTDYPEGQVYHSVHKVRCLSTRKPY